MSEPADRWAQEIRDYLLGRLSSQTTVGSLPSPQDSELTHPPVRRWWTFEGKQYKSLGGSLASNWGLVIANAWRLEQTFNPKLRLSDRPDGVVDWAQTIARGPRHLFSDFVVRSSAIGLGEEERAALRGWAAWISAEWSEYARANGLDEHLDWRGFPFEPDSTVGTERLRRWAHIAKRSRWPLLRDVVAETLRPVLETDELDRVPLPADPPTLFELLCLVRIARELAPIPADLRWLSLETTGNTMRLEGVFCSYQQSLSDDDVLATPEYRGPLATAVQIFAVGKPGRIDLAFDFDTPRAGFDSILVEAKSGAQQYDAAVSQLRIYRAVRKLWRPQSRILVWGIIERPAGSDATCEQIAKALAAAGPEDDVWLFSSVDAIPMVLDTVFADAQRLESHSPSDSVKQQVVEAGC